MTETHQYYRRAKCVCGYIWTTTADGKVVCRCGESKINIDTIEGIAVEVTDEEEFKNAVDKDLFQRYVPRASASF